MKVLFRMLASILPGVIVGLGVIAYLERDSLKEQWIAYSQDSTGVEQAEQEQISRFEPIALPASPPPVAPAAAVSEPKPASAAAVAEKTAVPVPSLAEVIGLEPPRAPLDQPNPEQAPVVSVVRPVESSVVESPVVDTPKRVVEPAVDPLAQKRATVMDQPYQRMQEVLEPMPAVSEPIAKLSKPMGDLAKQFDPRTLLSQPQSEEGGAKKDVWHLGESDSGSESQLQWLWNRGRQAFWEGDYESAVESYRSLLEEDANNTAAWGELGNIYYAKKDWVRAVRAFGRSAAALIGEDRVEEARKIIQVIRSIDPVLAQKLEADLPQQR